MRGKILVNRGYQPHLEKDAFQATTV